MSGINPHVKLKIIRKYDFKCVYCGHKGSRANYLTVDHVFPKDKGGPKYHQSNLVCSCKVCNQEKSNKLLTDFIKKNNIKMTPELAEFL